MVEDDKSGKQGGWLQRWKPRLAEMFVIVLGILLAFQVEEWREERAEQRDVRTALDRLLVESSRNLETCQQVEPYLRKNVLAMEHVFKSLENGAFVDGDQELFDYGLIVYDVVPNIRLNTSVADEMLATGLLKEVDDDDLRSRIGWLPSLESESRDSLAYWRSFIVALFEELTSVVEYSYDGRAIVFDSGNSLFTPDNESVTEFRMTVSYDLDDLSANRRLRNLFFEAVDVHGDLWGDLDQRCDVVKDIRDRLTGPGES